MNANNQYALLTLIVIIVVIFVIHDKTLAVLMIGALIGYYFAVCSAVKNGNRPPVKIPDQGVEHFSTSPSNFSPRSIYNEPLKEKKYLGDIDFDILDSLRFAADNFNEKENGPSGNENGPSGNEMLNGHEQNIGVSHTRKDACVDYQANLYPMNADELTTQNQLSRNEPTKAIAGSIRNRQSQASKYTSEEMAQSEARPWWGRSEQ